MVTMLWASLKDLEIMLEKFNVLFPSFLDLIIVTADKETVVSKRVKPRRYFLQRKDEMAENEVVLWLNVCLYSECMV